MPPIITLTTDFGLEDEYAGVIHGVLATLAPQAHLIDLCHHIRPQDIRQAAFILSAAPRALPRPRYSRPGWSRPGQWRRALRPRHSGAQGKSYKTCIPHLAH